MCPVDVTWRSKNAWYDSFWRSGIQTSLLTFRCPWCSAFSILCILPRNRHIGPTATRIFQFIQEEAFWQILEHVDGWNVCFLRPYHIDMHYFLSSSTGWRWVCLKMLVCWWRHKETPTLCGGWEDCGTAGSRNGLGREKSHGSTTAKGKDQHAWKTQKIKGSGYWQNCGRSESCCQFFLAFESFLRFFQAQRFAEKSAKTSALEVGGFSGTESTSNCRCCRLLAKRSVKNVGRNQNQSKRWGLYIVI